MKTVAMILAGGAGTRLDILSEHRAKPAVPFGGKYRIIDFTLSNCVNSGINYVAVLTQYLPRSLSEHIGIGMPWDFDRKFGGVEILSPFQGHKGEWYSGTANAVYQNMHFFLEKKADHILILSGDHVYKMDYRKMIKFHESKDADLTIAVKSVEKEIAGEFGIVVADKEKRIVEFDEKPKNPKSNLASMGIYIFKSSVLTDILDQSCLERKGVDFGKDIIPEMINTKNVFAYSFKDYWRDVGTLEEYWKSNMELTQEVPPLDLHDHSENTTYTKSWDLPPAKFGKNGSASSSLISDGCIINGTVENSVISSNVIVEEGVVIKKSIVFGKSIIKKGAVIDRTIIDKNVVVGENCKIGHGEDMTPNKEVPRRLYSGLNIIGKNTTIPEATVIGRNCRILSDVTDEDFKEKLIGSGESVAPSGKKIRRD